MQTRAMKEQTGGECPPAADERVRLQALVGELVYENQRLRFENQELHARIEQLQREARSAERRLAEATRWAGMLF